MTLLQYAHDNKGRLFPYNHTPVQALWQLVVLPYLTPATRRLDLYTNNATMRAEVTRFQLQETVYFCPLARDPLNESATGTAAGSSVHCWGPAGNATGGMRGSYFFNGWLYRMGAGGTDDQALTYATGVPGWSTQRGARFLLAASGQHQQARPSPPSATASGWTAGFTKPTRRPRT